MPLPQRNQHRACQMRSRLALASGCPVSSSSPAPCVSAVGLSQRSAQPLLGQHYLLVFFLAAPIVALVLGCHRCRSPSQPGQPCPPSLPQLWDSEWPPATKDLTHTNYDTGVIIDSQGFPRQEAEAHQTLFKYESGSHDPRMFSSWKSPAARYSWIPWC